MVKENKQGLHVTHRAWDLLHGLISNLNNSLDSSGYVHACRDRSKTQKASGCAGFIYNSMDTLAGTKEIRQRSGVSRYTSQQNGTFCKYQNALEDLVYVEGVRFTLKSTWVQKNKTKWVWMQLGMFPARNFWQVEKKSCSWYLEWWGRGTDSAFYELGQNGPEVHTRVGVCFSVLHINK